MKTELAVPLGQAPNYHWFELPSTVKKGHWQKMKNIQNHPISPCSPDTQAFIQLCNPKVSGLFPGFQGNRVPGFQGSGSVPALGLGTNQCTTPRLKPNSHCCSIFCRRISWFSVVEQHRKPCAFSQNAPPEPTGLHGVSTC